MATLFMIIKRKYFNQIVTGEKKWEYRSITNYWLTKLVGREYDTITFQAGYKKDSPRHVLKYSGYELQKIKHEFFGAKKVFVLAIKL